MKRHLSEGLKRVGITHKTFYGDTAGFRLCDPAEPAPAWGVTLYKNGQVLAVVSSTPRGHGGNGKWYIRKPGQFKNLPDTSYAYPTQREAIAGLIQEHYQITNDELAEHRARQRREQMKVV